MHRAPSAERSAEGVRICLTASLDRDSLHLTLSFGLLRQSDRQHAILEGRFYFVRVHVLTDRNNAVERSFPTFAIYRAALLQTLLTLQGEHAFIQCHVDVPLLESGKLRNYPELVRGFRQLDLGPGGPGASIQVACKIIEHPVHFTVQRQKRTFVSPKALPLHAAALAPRNEIFHIHDLIPLTQIGSASGRTAVLNAATWV